MAGPKAPGYLSDYDEAAFYTKFTHHDEWYPGSAAEAQSSKSRGHLRAPNTGNGVKLSLSTHTSAGSLISPRRRSEDSHTASPASSSAQYISQEIWTPESSPTRQNSQDSGYSGTSASTWSSQDSVMSEGVDSFAESPDFCSSPAPLNDDFNQIPRRVSNSTGLPRKNSQSELPFRS